MILGLVLTQVVITIFGYLVGELLLLGDTGTWVGIILVGVTCLVLTLSGAIRVWRGDGSAAQTGAPTSPGRPAPTEPKPRWMKGVTVLMVGLAATAAAGLGAGNIAFEVLDISDAGAWVAASAVWLIGFILSVRASRKAARPM